MFNSRFYLIKAVLLVLFIGLLASCPENSPQNGIISIRLIGIGDYEGKDCWFWVNNFDGTYEDEIIWKESIIGETCETVVCDLITDEPILWAAGENILYPYVFIDVDNSGSIISHGDFEFFVDSYNPPSTAFFVDGDVTFEYIFPDMFQEF